MKKHQIFLKAFLCLGLITIFSACSKDDPKPDCKIITITPDTGDPVNISYNSEGRISTISSGTTLTTFAYSGNTAIGTRTNSGAFDAKIIVTNNANGLATNIRTENNMAGTDWDNIAMDYSGTELVKQTSTSSAGGTPSVTTVAWTGGNPSTLTSGATVQSVEYYADIPAQTGDYWDLAQTMQGYRIIKTKNAMKSILSGASIANLDYVFDGDGKISGVNITGASNFSYTFQHQCN